MCARTRVAIRAGMSVSMCVGMCLGTMHVSGLCLRMRQRVCRGMCEGMGRHACSHACEHVYQGGRVREGDRMSSWLLIHEAMHSGPLRFRTCGQQHAHLTSQLEAKLWSKKKEIGLFSAEII